MASRSVIEEFRAAVEADDAQQLAHLLSEDVRFFGSASHKPFEGKATATMVQAMLSHICDDIEFVSEVMSEDRVVLLARGRVNEMQFDGATFLTFDENGLIIEIRDFVRPLSALTALRDAAGAYLATLSEAPA